MEHDNEQPQDPTEMPQDEQQGDEPDGCGMVILKIIAGIIVLFIVAVALVFGVCLMA